MLSRYLVIPLFSLTLLFQGVWAQEAEESEGLSPKKFQHKSWHHNEWYPPHHPSHKSWQHNYRRESKHLDHKKYPGKKKHAYKSNPYRLKPPFRHSGNTHGHEEDGESSDSTADTSTDTSSTSDTSSDTSSDSSSDDCSNHCHHHSHYYPYDYSDDSSHDLDYTQYPQQHGPVYSDHDKKEKIKHNIYPSLYEEDFIADPIGRAMDLVDAFNKIKERFPEGRYFVVADGQSIDGIIDMEITEGETMLLLTIEYGSRQEIRAIPVEDISSVGCRNTRKKRSSVRILRGGR